MENTPNYRKISYSPSEISAAIKLAENLRPIENMINVDFESLTKKEYDDWVVEWKNWYSYYSTVSSALKKNAVRKFKAAYGTEFSITPINDQSRRMSAISDVRKISNTLLNARLFGKEVRRRISPSI